MHAKVINLEDAFTWVRDVDVRKQYMVLVISIIVIIITGVIVWNYSDTLTALKHETDRWAAIQDRNGDRIAAETTSDVVWNELVRLHENLTERWIGSIVVEYDSKWGFRFKPENVTIAEYTVEGTQTTIKSISEDLDYWLNLGWAYVWAGVTEIHSNA